MEPKRKGFTSDVEFDKLMEAIMTSIIDDETFFPLLKAMWIGDFGDSCHVTNNDTGFYDVTNRNELVQGSLGSMSTKKEQTEYKGTSS